MSERVMRGAALLTAGIALALSLAAVVMFALTPGLDVLSGWGFAGYDALFALVYAAVGLLIATRRPHNLIGWLFLASALLSGMQTVTGAYAGYARAADPAGSALAYWFTGWIWIPAVGVIVLTLLLYPNSRLPSRRWRWAALGLVPVTVVTTLLWAIASPDAALTPDRFGVDPLGLAPDHPLRLVAGPSLLLLTGWFLVAAASLAVRMRGGDAVQRQQIKWIAFAAGVLAVALGTSVLTSLAAPEDVVAKATQIVSIVAVLLIPIAATVAILRYRLYDIDLLINRALVYGAVTAGLAATYLLTVILVQAIVRPFTLDNELAVAGSTLAVVALFGPLRGAVQRFVDRRFYRSRYDAALTLDAFTARLREQVDLDDVRAGLVGAVQDTLRPVHVSLWLREARSGAATADPRTSAG